MPTRLVTNLQRFMGPLAHFIASASAFAFLVAIWHQGDVCVSVRSACVSRRVFVSTLRLLPPVEVVISLAGRCP